MKKVRYYVGIIGLLSVILLQLISIHTASAQSSNIRFLQLSIEEGLPQNMVDCIIQDRQGFIWIGTWNGLSKYDGYTFETFSNSDHTSYELGNNFVYALYEDHFGNIWVGTKEGLYLYIYDHEQFFLAESLLASSSSILNGTINSIRKHSDSTFWVGTAKGLVLLEAKDAKGSVKLLKSLRFGDEPYNLNGSTVNDVLTDQNAHTWVATNEGVNVLSPDFKEIKHYGMHANYPYGLTSDQALTLLESDNGSIWIGTETGLNKYDPDTDGFIGYLHDEGDESTLLHNTIMDLDEDLEGNILIATLGGYSIFDTEDNLFSNFQHERNHYSLSNNFVNCIMQDKYGNVWLGTERGGVSYYSSSQSLLEHYEHRPEVNNSLSNNTINSIYEDEENLWVGTAGGGLNRYHKESRSYQHYRHKAHNSNTISSDFVTTIFRDSDANLWLGTWGGGINRLVREGSTPEYFEHIRVNNIDSGLVSDFISSIDQDPVGKLWIGTLGGISCYDPLRETIIPIQSAVKGVDAISEVGCLLFDSNDRLWIGTRSGLYRFVFSEDFDQVKSIKKFESSTLDQQSMSGNYVISLMEDQEGSIWVGTYGQGINKLIETDKGITFKSYNTSDGLSNNIIFGIAQDKNGDIWMTTDYGLSRFNPLTENVKNYYQYNGFLNNQYYWSSLIVTQDGKIYAGGMNGLDAFFPAWLQEDTVNKKVLITDVELLNNPVLPGNEYNGIMVTKQNVSKTNGLNLSYKEKQISIEFSSLNYQENKLISYEYILEGFENKWNRVDSRQRFASYTNLKPGDYKFKVRTVSPDEAIFSSPTVLNIHISTPYWDTVWFRLLMLTTLVGLVWAYIRFRTYTLKKQKVQLEQQVIDRTEKINLQKEELARQAEKLLSTNSELEDKQQMIRNQYEKLDTQNKEILSQRDKLIELNNKLKLITQLRLSFFTNISHEFRTPLTLIISPLEKLLQEKNFSVESKDALKTISRNAQRLLHLIDQIMNFRKIEQGRIELRARRSSISDFCKNIFGAFEQMASIKKISFSYHEADLPDEVWFDAQKMENILYNLLSNAFKYTPENGEIRLVVRGIDKQASKLSLDSAPEDINYLLSISVVDTGVGISKENLPLVFKRFYRVESDADFKIRGSGIGLALTEELIRAHHGDIFVESTPGKGSVFEIQFPCLKGFYSLDELVEEEQKDHRLTIDQQIEMLREELTFTHQHEHEVIEIEKKSNDKATVLIVEDNFDLRRFLVHQLRDKYRIIEASNGAIAIDLAKKHNPDLILSDVMMPEMNGLELCTYIKNNLSTSHIPIILLTAKSSEEHEIKGLDTGADEYLSKPFNLELLEARIRNLLMSRKKLKQLYNHDYKTSVETVTTNKKDADFLKYAVTLINDQMADPEFGVKEFIKEMGVSRSLLHKKLSALVNQSASEFINHVRMRKAQELLIKNELNISEVAYSVGYNDPKYFSRLFSKIFGQSPKEFQHQHPTRID